ncbi:hypothetical protein Srubr_34590 [Streptomyces rubradiris]|uniref:Uncharacterized protein n=1 Tax=Streptomyces rubradiris TaxID=285531 RepID=A0ABQ3RCQ1_STRRR|nr:hypothetical protein Srubr_34590 [Streptomyces rubradiris]
MRGTVQTRNLGTGPGDAVDVHLPDSRRRLRFQLASLDHRAWRRAVDELAGDADDLDWVFGPDTPVTRDLAGRHGFCLRVRSETVGGERRVHIGAETQDRQIQWTPLDECVLTPNGLSTPDVETIRLPLPRPKPPSFPILGSLLFALVPEAEVPISSPFAADDRHLVVADVRPTDSPIVRALLSLPGDTDLPPVEHVYRIPDSARMLVTEDGGWAIRANRYLRLDAHEAQRTGLWTPAPVSDTPTAAPVLSPRNATTTPQQGAESQTQAQPSAHQDDAAQPQASTALNRSDLIMAVREALMQCACEATTTTWPQLAQAVGCELDDLSQHERRDLLVEVDTPLWGNVPVLSALIRQGRHPLPYLDQVLAGLGVGFAQSSPWIPEWASVEAERAFAAYSRPPRAMPPRLDLSPTRKQPSRSQADGQAVTKQSTRRGSGTVGSGSSKAPIRVIPPSESTMARVQTLIDEYRELRARLTQLAGKKKKVENKVLLDAEAWLSFHGRPALAQAMPQQQRTRLASLAGNHVTHLLEVQIKLLRRTIKEEEILIKYERRRNPPNEESLSAVPATGAPVTPVPATSSTPSKTSASKAEERLRRQLVRTASLGETIPLLDLEGGRTLPDDTLRRMLTAIDRSVSPDVPLLSALVTAPDGGPVLFFRRLLSDLGLAVPHSNEVLLMVWRREQERAHATYADPPRPLPPRLVPMAQGGQRAEAPPT